ncbi:MAG: hypothetical protein QOJ07_757 [Thermoleophilaceae bacterium]|nr:hypothetical protein [Thermoleophilaceae bacterium]
MGLRAPGSNLRAGALVASGSFLVHEARYALGYGHEAGAALAAQGHAYLTALSPVVAVLLALALGTWVAAAARGAAPALGSRPSAGPAWRSASASLVAIYVIQESLEGMLAAGHPAGIAGIAGHGGWTAVPLALAVGGAIALLLRGARVAQGALARPWIPVALVPSAPPSLAVPAAPPAGARPRVLARRMAGRAPPLAS